MDENNYELIRKQHEVMLPDNIDPETLERFKVIEKLKKDHEFARAVDLAQELVTDLLAQTEDIEKVPLHFDNSVQETLYLKRHPDYVPGEPDLPLYQALYSLGSLLIECKYPNEAIDPLKLSLSLSPYSPYEAIEYIEALKQIGDLDEAEKVIKYALSFTYKPEQIAHLIRSLGFIYIEREKYDIARMLYLISIEIDESPIAYEELAYISVKNEGIPELNLRNLDAFLKENNIDIIPQYKIATEILEYLYDQFENGQLDIEDLDDDMQDYFEEALDLLHIDMDEDGESKE